ncbi:MAG: GNAT family N-acetyltransferase [Calditrichaeota bacterium]|nr:GNAT family N-acetyltransferase [Calditrichota bacterium]
MSENKVENKKRKWELQKYSPGDENAICALFERVFGKPMGATESMRHWQWEFIDNHLKEIFIKLAWDKDQLVGQYAANPVRMYANGRNIIAALSLDTMTDPQYGGLGIFKNAAESVYTDLDEAGYHFIYGFPNRNSIHGIIRNLKWHQIMTTPVHIRPIQITTHISRHFRMKKPDSLMTPIKSTLSHKEISLLHKSRVYNLRVESEFGDWVDDLWQRCRDQHRLWVIRDKSYLNWRYIDRPESNYSIISAWCGARSVGYFVTTIVEKGFGYTLFVLDFMVDLNFKNVAETLIRHIVKMAQFYRVGFASVLLTPGSRYRNLFRRHLFIQLPEILFPKPLYFGGRCFDKSMEEVVFNSQSWSISWGDNDVL